MTKVCPFQQRIRRAVDGVLETEGQPRCLRDECQLWLGDAVDGNCAFAWIECLFAILADNSESTLRRWVE